MADATLLDLSAAGCALRTHKILRNKEEVEVDIPIGRGCLRVRAQIRNCTALAGDDVQWRYGLRFMGLNADDIQLLQNEVMRCQRDLLAEIANRRVFV